MSKNNLFKSQLYSVRDVFSASPIYMTVCTLISFYPVLNSLIPIMTAAIIGAAQDIIANGAAPDELWRSLFILLSILSATTIFGCAASFLYSLLDLKCRRFFGQKLFAKTLKMPQISFENTDTYEKYRLAYRSVEDNADSEGNSMLTFFAIVIDLISTVAVIIAAIAVMASYSYIFIFFAVASTAASLVINIKKVKTRTKLRRRQVTKTRLSEYFWSLFYKKEAIKEMRVFGAEGFFSGKWKNTRDEMLNEEAIVEGKLRFQENLGDTIKNLFYGINIGISIYLMMNGTITAAQFSGCLVAFGSLQLSIVTGIYALDEMLGNMSKNEDYYNFMSLENERDGDAECGIFKDCIEFKNVSFSYPNTDRPAVKNVSLKINRGEHIVIVGENGSGKTTLSKLMTGCFSPASGAVLFDGTDISGIKKQELLKSFSVVGQDFIHYNLTLRENIAISDYERINDDNSLYDAIQRADLSDISDAIGGLDSELGREFGGSELSGGQWQKIAIARGIFRNAPVLILDEPTSALDPLIEYDILNKFTAMTHDKTSVIISHRVGICRSADKIIVMKNGEICEIGKHADLLERSGEYSRIWNSQAQWIT